MIVEEADNRVDDDSMTQQSNQDGGEASMPKMTTAGLMGEKMRQNVDKQVKVVSDDKLRIYNTIQLTTELEAIKK